MQAMRAIEMRASSPVQTPFLLWLLLSDPFLDLLDETPQRSILGTHTVFTWASN